MDYEVSSPDPVANQILFQQYMHIAGITILFWDHLLTFDDEFEYIWSRPKIISSYLFFVNRYLSFFGAFPGNFVVFSMVNFDSCMKYLVFQTIYGGMRGLVVYCAMCLRVYALYERSRFILVAFVCLTLILIGASTWAGLGLGSGGAFALTLKGCIIGIESDEIMEILVIKTLPWIGPNT
ncbi:hypothetical protein K435DRAFT_836962 [Dendrothele bispora CBS 962.96]|uniref:DUF6533 domain-containing protein n=1 Tax=Dendrothele bispora (strain CBS 962.96) TaxID=1314807 RepID=A0A4S8MG84_DENBC|nr:hypothetical protein K435DRAFT_836962 [Dendrothele bispora CBS 962.96]